MIETATSAHLDSFLEKIERRTLTAGVVGLGYVGLPLTQLFTSCGSRVIGLDIDASKVAKLMRGESYIRHLPSILVQEMIAKDLLAATSDFSRLAGAELRPDAARQDMAARTVIDTRNATKAVSNGREKIILA